MVSQFMPQVQLWRYWPVIIVAFGIRGMFGPSGGPWTIKSLAEGLTVVAFGLVFLGQMTGYLDWKVWLNILKLWPLLLVSVGLEIIGKGVKSEWVRAIGSIVIIAGLAYGSLVMTDTGGWPLTFVPAVESKQFEFSEARDRSVDEGVARIDGGVGSLTVEAGDELATSEGRSPFEPVFEVEQGSRSADVRIGLGDGTWGPMTTDAALDVTLSRDVTWDLEIHAGVTDYEVDLSEVPLGHLDFDAGVSDGTLVLGPSDAAGGDGPVEADVKAGVSSLRIRVPEGDDVRVSVRAGLGSVDVRGDWRGSRDGDERVYESEEFDDSGEYWDVRVEAGVGSVTIEYY
ncbi:MAG: hypothetical protein EG823_06105 [Actinobacteria bacterium]|nr:hypothetical protein [Actinomycetota bacterium]